METEGTASFRKRSRTTTEEKEGDIYDEATHDIQENAETEAETLASEEIELNITGILEKIERFTHLVSGLLDSGKAMFKELSNEFEERLIAIHKEQVEKWQEEIKELRLLDSSNEETNALLHNARLLLQHPHMSPEYDSPHGAFEFTG